MRNASFGKHSELPNRGYLDRVLGIGIFLVGAMSYIDINVAGRVSASELLMVALLPLALLRCPWPRQLSKLWWFIGLAVLGVTISDLVVNDVGLDRYLKGIARFGFLAIITGFWTAVLVNNFGSLLLYMWGLIPGTIINLLRVSEFDRGTVIAGSVGYDFWATKVSPLLIASVTLAAFYLFNRSRFWSAVVLFCGAVLNALFASRSRSAFLFIAGFASLRRRSPGFSEGRRNSSALWVLSLAAMLAYGAYIYTAPRGYLGDYQREKFNEQTRSVFGATPWGILLSGRVDMLECTLAIWDQPLWGTGSWSIPRTYVLEASELLRIPPSDALERSVEVLGESAGHSVIFGSWATSGILVLPLWAFIAWLTWSAGMKIVRTPDPLLGFLTMLAANVSFSLFFNPLSLSTRNNIGLFVAIAVAFNCLDDGRRWAQAVRQRHAIGERHSPKAKVLTGRVC